MGTDTSTVAEPEKPRPTQEGLDRYFKISERGSAVGREVRGGLATFFTMAYIVVLNPIIIGTVADTDGQFLGDQTGAAAAIPLVAAATALVAAVMTTLMGIVGRYPFAIATGLGLNAFVTFSLASRMSWEDAMGLVVIEGLAITVLVLVGVRGLIFRAIPTDLKTAIAVGIGLFIALIGFVDAGFVQPGTPVLQLGRTSSLSGWPILVFVIGVIAIAIMVAKRVTGAILIGIIGGTILSIIIEAIADIGAYNAETNPDGWRLTVPSWPDEVTASPDLGLIGQFSLGGGIAEVGVIAGLLFILTLLLADFFDTMGTITGVGAEPACSTRTAISPAPTGYCWWTRRRPPQAVQHPSRPIRPTSSRRPALARAPGPGWRASSPDCSSSARCS